LPETSTIQGEDVMPFVNIRIVKEVIAADPAGQRGALSRQPSHGGRGLNACG
jgi:hypothetical protein